MSREEVQPSDGLLPTCDEVQWRVTTDLQPALVIGRDAHNSQEILARRQCNHDEQPRLQYFVSIRKHPDQALGDDAVCLYRPAVELDALGDLRLSAPFCHVAIAKTVHQTPSYLSTLVSWYFANKSKDPTASHHIRSSPQFKDILQIVKSKTTQRSELETAGDFPQPEYIQRISSLSEWTLNIQQGHIADLLSSLPLPNRMYFETLVFQGSSSSPPVQALLVGYHCSHDSPLYACWQPYNGGKRFGIWAVTEKSKQKVRLADIGQHNVIGPFERAYPLSPCSLDEDACSRFKILVSWYFIAAGHSQCVELKDLEEYQTNLEKTLEWVEHDMPTTQRSLADRHGFEADSIKTQQDLGPMSIPNTGKEAKTKSDECTHPATAEGIVADQSTGISHMEQEGISTLSPVCQSTESTRAPSRHPHLSGQTPKRPVESYDPSRKRQRPNEHSLAITESPDEHPTEDLSNTASSNMPPCARERTSSLQASPSNSDEHLSDRNQQAQNATPTNKDHPISIQSNKAGSNFQSHGFYRQGYPMQRYLVSQPPGPALSQNSISTADARNLPEKVAHACPLADRMNLRGADMQQQQRRPDPEAEALRISTRPNASLGNGVQVSHHRDFPDATFDTPDMLTHLLLKYLDPLLWKDDEESTLLSCLERCWNRYESYHRSSHADFVQSHGHVLRAWIKERRSVMEFRTEIASQPMSQAMKEHAQETRRMTRFNDYRILNICMGKEQFTINEKMLAKVMAALCNIRGGEVWFQRGVFWLRKFRSRN